MKADPGLLLTLAGALLAALPGWAGAQVAPQPADPVGRLFYTPAQRAQLDTARSQRARITFTDEAEAQQAAAPTPQTLTYGGMVRRSDGRSTVWINNRPVHDNELGAGAVVGRVRPDGRVSLQTTQSGRSFELKPGQSVELLSGTIEESYARRQPSQIPTAVISPAAKSAPMGKKNSEIKNIEKSRPNAAKDVAPKQSGSAVSAQPATPAP